MWLCTAMLVVAASALSAVTDAAQLPRLSLVDWRAVVERRRGGCLALAGPMPAALPLLQLVFVPWPLLCLLGFAASMRASPCPAAYAAT